MALLIVDMAAIMLCFGSSFFIINLIDHSLINFRSFVTYWVYLPVFIGVFYASKLYPGIMLPPADEVRRVSLCCACLFAGIALSIEVETDDRTALWAAFLLAIPFAVIVIPLAREIARHIFSRFPWWGVGTIVYSSGTEGRTVIDRLLEHPELGYRPVLIVDTGGVCKDGGGAQEGGLGAGGIGESGAQEAYRGIPCAPPTDATHEFIKRRGYKTAIIVESRTIDINESALANFIMTHYRYTILIPHTKMTTVVVAVRDLGGILGFASTHNLTKRGNLLIKRGMDITVCLLFSPLILLVSAAAAVLVKLSSPGPVLYGHKRIGRGGKEITTWKFRTMVVDADKKLREILESNPLMKAQWELKQKIDNDPRVTAIGKFLRRTSIDEVPQLWNIFIGEMSLAGPRPITKAELDKYGAKTSYMLSVTPGLSGLWQISGRSETSYEDRILLDTYYIENWSIWLDVWILLKTAGAVAGKKGAV
ncbi:MAG: exopolysaccharide biosynthesis polyprenyl glycosylphosphotransferase [Spirochaetaceae bacterium]|nr:exopolysaccharide biosynthesis polyprenyl glycosylphosphotransferase [Spirochaetaceae bacterium]